MAVRIVSPRAPTPRNPDSDERHLTRLLQRAEWNRHPRVFLLAEGAHPYGTTVEVRPGLHGRACRMDLPASSCWTSRTCTAVAVSLPELRIYLGHALLGLR